VHRYPMHEALLSNQRSARSSNYDECTRKTTIGCSPLHKVAVGKKDAAQMVCIR